MNKYIKLFTSNGKELKYIVENKTIIVVTSKESYWSKNHIFNNGDISCYHQEPCTKAEVVKYKLLYG